jgi:hypothetical protein
MAGDTDKSSRYLRWAATNEGRAASAYNEELKTLFLHIAAQYGDLAEQIGICQQYSFPSMEIDKTGGETGC